MSKLVHGAALTFAQRAEVLRSFVHRWTVENANQTYRGKCPACEQAGRNGWPQQIISADGPKRYTREEWHAYHAPLISDAQWLADHAFYITKDGHLDQRKEHCEPAYMAELS